VCATLTQDCYASTADARIGYVGDWGTVMRWNVRSGYTSGGPAPMATEAQVGSNCTNRGSERIGHVYLVSHPEIISVDNDVCTRRARATRS